MYFTHTLLYDDEFRVDENLVDVKPMVSRDVTNNSSSSSLSTHVDVLVGNNSDVEAIEHGHIIQKQSSRLRDFVINTVAVQSINLLTATHARSSSSGKTYNILLC